MFIMESVGKKKPRPRRSLTAEFKAEIAELCQRRPSATPAPVTAG
jgi:transposase